MGAGPECSVLIGVNGVLLVAHLVSLDLSVFHPLVELADDCRGDQGDGKDNNVEQGSHGGSFQEVFFSLYTVCFLRTNVLRSLASQLKQSKSTNKKVELGELCGTRHDGSTDQLNQEQVDGHYFSFIARFRSFSRAECASGFLVMIS